MPASCLLAHCFGHGRIPFAECEADNLSCCTECIDDTLWLEG
ncbi:MAG: hypothetical protein KatS3mg059_1012 [Thermomicrobiales bacterium]|nr:MAG: hypothetical protein KatS3mg059_1012 [Thermomicrobiales bacterium]